MIAVRRGWGSTEVALLLFHEIVKFTERRGMRHWVAILNDTVLERIQLLGEPFRLYTGVEPGPYAGSVSSSPVWAEAAACFARMTPGVHACIVGDGIVDRVGGRGGLCGRSRDGLSSE